MATNDHANNGELSKMPENIARVEQLMQRMGAVLKRRKNLNQALDGPNHSLFINAGKVYWQQVLQNPAQIFEQQMVFWGASLQYFISAQQDSVTAAQTAQIKFDIQDDPRFAHPLWHTNPYFKLLRQQYLLNSAIIRSSVASLADLTPTDKQRLKYFCDQIIEIMAPTNFLMTNPEALEKAVATNGQSLIDGLENLVNDLEANDGELVVRLADQSAFEVGVNIAISKGQVVFRNRMMELIQYEAVQPEVRAVPLVIFPPWINKYYILDLKAQNSFIKWVTEQGYTVFVVSWVNPDASYADVGIEEYINEGYLTALATVKEITNRPRVNVIGYCIGGTVLSLVLSLFKKRGDASIASATFFTTLTDFSQQGEFMPFLQDDFVDGIEQHVETYGLLPAFILSRTFSFLRSNDLIFQPAIKSYMLGETPPSFDLLYWNGDATGLPAKMVSQYLRELCQKDRFATSGLALLGEVLHLSDVSIPICAIACENDHIAAWPDSYRGFQQMRSRSKTFILTQSGHIGGIINPPSKKKYGHYTNTDLRFSHSEWRDKATFHDGSWWPRWERWLRGRSGNLGPAQTIGSSKFPPLCSAPGTYVRPRE